MVAARNMRFLGVLGQAPENLNSLLTVVVKGLLEPTQLAFFSL